MQPCQRQSGQPTRAAITASRQQEAMSSNERVQQRDRVAASYGGILSFNEEGAGDWQTRGHFIGIALLEPLQDARQVYIRPGPPTLVNIAPHASSRTMAQVHTSTTRVENDVYQQLKPQLSSNRAIDDEKEVAVDQGKVVVVDDGKEAVVAAARHSSHVKLLGCCGMPSSALVDQTWRKGVAKAHGLSFLLERCENRFLLHPARHLVHAICVQLAEVCDKRDAKEYGMELWPY